MKKSLLTLACALLCSGAAVAQGSGVMYEGLNFTNVSPNGRWLTENKQGVMAYIFDSQTKENWTFFDENNLSTWFIGYGHSVTDEGMVCGSTQVYNEEAGWGYYSDAAYFKGGEWHVLPQLSGRETGMNSANAVTPDEYRICGAQGVDNSSYDKDNLMMYPVIWTKSANGEYECQALPYPTRDFTNRTPQYVTAMDISADGKTVVGQVVDYSGFYTYPIVYNEKADGTWTYRLVNTSLVWDQSKLDALPAVPDQPTYPNVDDYMSEQDMADYNAAYDYYYECYYQCVAGDMDWSELPQFPSKNEYISDETKKAEYEAAMDQYQIDNDAWYEAFSNFQDALQEATTGASFVFNQTSLSPNGLYYLTCMSAPDPNADPDDFWAPSLSLPKVLDLSKEDGVSTIAATDKLTANILNNGRYLVTSPASSYARNAYVANVGSEEVTPLVDWLNEMGQNTAAEFLKTNCVFDITDYAWNDETGSYEEVVLADSLITGTPIFSGDGKHIVSWYENPETNAIDTYVLSLDISDEAAAIEGVKADEEATVIGREYYNLQGQRIAAPVEGVYLEKVITSKGTHTNKCVK